MSDHDLGMARWLGQQRIHRLFAWVRKRIQIGSPRRTICEPCALNFLGLLTDQLAVA
jgi:hypothetical protein